MADQLLSNRVTGETLGSELPLRISQLETAISIITGVPLDQLINNPMFSVDGTGLKQTNHQDLLSDPGIFGAVARVGRLIRYNDGIGIRTVLTDVFSDITERRIVNSGVETNLFNVTMPGGFLGGGGVVHATAEVFVNAMINGGNLQLKFYLGGGLFHTASLTNSTGTQVGSFFIHNEIRIQNRNSAAVQAITVASEIPANIGPTLAFANSGARLMVGLGGTFNTANDIGLIINGLWSSADTGNDCTGMGLDGWRTKG